MARSTLMKLGFRYPRMDLCCLAERVDGLNGNNEMLSKLPHHDIIILFQNDSYLPYYRNYTREEIYMGWHDAAFQSKNYDTETYKKVQNNSYKIARRSIILLQIGIGFLIPFALTIVMGFIYTIATFQILDPTEYLSEWLYSMGITFVLCFVPLFWGPLHMRDYRLYASI